MHPRYSAIKEYKNELVDSDQWTVGFRIPSDKRLAEQFEASRTTTNRALYELTDGGLLARISAVGTLEAQHLPQVPLFENKNTAEAILPDDMGLAFASTARLTHPNNAYRLGGHFVPDRGNVSMRALASNRGCADADA